MEAEELIEKRVMQSCGVKQKSLEAIKGPVARAGDVIVQVLKSGHKLLTAGNGGSAADAQHMEAELVGRFLMERPGAACVCLNTNPSTMTALVNDYPPEMLFSRQVEALGARGDVFMGFSTSGNSPNIVNALSAGRDAGLATIGVTGEGGGRMADLCDILIPVSSTETPRIQEVHLLVVHLICEMVEREMFGE